ncbi:AmmeMemoRadiSam system protein A [Desulfobacterales bacterium HSG16]|nr:AmmeMemoRadiSam system protein A [Desulfobacterales bacterium HSG16]
MHNNINGQQISESGLLDEEKKYLLKMARTTIQSKLGIDSGNEDLAPTSKTMLEKRGCFVTIHLHGNLRGCIGTIEPVTPLIDGIRENAINAAFKDPRFPPLNAEELADADIEISVLTIPEVLEYSGTDDLLEKLEPKIHGVILSSDWHRSTFLPQVWDQLPDTETFLEHLCVKGGMGQDCWKNEETQVMVYKAEYFGEKD